MTRERLDAVDRMIANAAIDYTMGWDVGGDELGEALLAAIDERYAALDAAYEEECGKERKERGGGEQSAIRITRTDEVLVSIDLQNPWDFACILGGLLRVYDSSVQMAHNTDFLLEYPKSGQWRFYSRTTKEI